MCSVKWFLKTEHKFYGITQDPETKIYMMVVNNKCNKCYYNLCNSIHFQRNFEYWTSGNNNIDKLIQETQLSVHWNVDIALEWIPCDKLYNIKYITKDELGEIYRANWTDGNIKLNSYLVDQESWDHKNQNWRRQQCNMFVNLKSLNTPNILTLEFVNKIKIEHVFYGITWNPETKNYMIVLNNIYWTSGNNNIDKFIQDTQLSTHGNIEKALEWVPYDKFCNIMYIAKDNEFGETYVANWIDGEIICWDFKNPNWKREDQDISVILKNLDYSENFKLELMKEIHKPCGITQNPETKNYMIVLHNWTSGNDDIDKFIQDTQLSAHDIIEKALEWIPYNRFYGIKYIANDEFNKVYSANWIDGEIICWDYESQNWKRKDQNISVILKNLDCSKNITSELMEKINKPCGITQDPETKNYMIVLNNICKKCNYACNAFHFQQKFIDWTGGNKDIDKFIQDVQLSAHIGVGKALEWIPYDRLYNIKYVAKDELNKMYSANWIDGEIICWDKDNQNWKREDQNISVILKNLDYSKNITSEFMEELKKPCGITQNPESKNYMMVLHSNKCQKCNKICNTIHFQQKFINWTSGNNDIDKFIQDTQLSAHDNIGKALEWVFYNRFYGIKCIANDKFNKVYSAYWIDGEIICWDYENQNWEREDQNIPVILKNLDYSKNITSELMKEV
uniref:Uncharacterized protein n=1 Tax=Rhizophagus irregularis (strain DAOM 181602 / DAOM 197198 / MUCL 43194) TaxID=747089 RepID=U9T9J9_RHIID